MEKKQKILFVSGSLNRGGAQRVITLLAAEYVRLGWSVHMAVLLDDQKGYEMDGRIVIHDLVRNGNKLKNAVRWRRDLRRLIREEKPDAVVSFAGRINLITLLAARGTGTPVLISERNDPARDRRSAPERWLCRKLYGTADRVVFQTNYQAAYYRKSCAHNSVIIGNPISAPAYSGEHARNDILCVGKLMDQKNHPMMIRAFARIADRFPDRQVVIFGEGSRRAELEELIRAEGLEGRILLPGNSSRIFEQMRTFAYFVMCSDYEGLSNALLEAMTSGMVCITTAWAGAEEIIRDGENGYLVPVGDDKALADKLEEVLQADGLQIAQAARETAGAFAEREILPQWTKEVAQMIEEKGGRK